MKIIIDAMSGDNAPQEIVAGAVRAADELGVEIVFVMILPFRSVFPGTENQDSLIASE